MNRKLNKKGFTLIEVVLVLAIGGLIFLLAFLAFQQVSKNRRDTQRRSDAGRLVAEVQNYAGDNSSGSLPTAATAGNAGTGAATGNFNSFINTYMKGSEFKGPSGNVYRLISTGNPAGPSASEDSQIKYTIGAASQTFCDGSAMTGSKDFKIEIGLESGIACRDSK